VWKAFLKLPDIAGVDRDEKVFRLRDLLVGAERNLTQGAAGKVTHLVGLKV